MDDDSIFVLLSFLAAIGFANLWYCRLLEDRAFFT
jgi:hypothetical protein